MGAVANVARLGLNLVNWIELNEWMSEWVSGLQNRLLKLELELELKPKLCTTREKKRKKTDVRIDISKCEKCRYITGWFLTLIWFDLIRSDRIGFLIYRIVKILYFISSHLISSKLHFLSASQLSLVQSRQFFIIFCLVKISILLLFAFSYPFFPFSRIE